MVSFSYEEDFYTTEVEITKGSKKGEYTIKITHKRKKFNKKGKELKGPIIVPKDSTTSITEGNIQVDKSGDHYAGGWMNGSLKDGKIFIVKIHCHDPKNKDDKQATSISYGDHAIPITEKEQDDALRSLEELKKQ